MVIVPNAFHGSTFAAPPDFYKARVLAFLNEAS
jgi:hypothetical protein